MMCYHMPRRASTRRARRVVQLLYNCYTTHLSEDITTRGKGRHGPRRSEFLVASRDASVNLLLNFSGECRDATFGFAKGVAKLSGVVVTLGGERAVHLASHPRDVALQRVSLGAEFCALGGDVVPDADPAPLKLDRLDASIPALEVPEQLAVLAAHEWRRGVGNVDISVVGGVGGSARARGGGASTRAGEPRGDSGEEARGAG